ncbi:hypothetical protein CRENBAI_026852 [Crenichthys baileyi]|uniref:Uncharacterized protein n=1 Tax=Crenichthys baileyi TaxID=28760 RepID=A0AAV9S9P3_9TELE
MRPLNRDPDRGKGVPEQGCSAEGRLCLSTPDRQPESEYLERLWRRTTRDDKDIVMDEEIETQEPTERGAEGPLPSTEVPTSTQLELQRFPTKVLRGGDGYSTWTSSVKEMFLLFNHEQSEDTLFKEKLRAIQDDDKESLVKEEYSEYGRPEQTKDHRTDSEVPTYDLTAETESEEEGNESEQEQDQKHAEPSRGLNITPYIVRQKGDIPQRIAQTKAEIQETIKKGILLSAALERHTGALKWMTYTSSHREQDPTQSKVRDLTFQFEQ